jgi:hypothetical protein
VSFQTSPGYIALKIGAAHSFMTPEDASAIRAIMREELAASEQRLIAAIAAAEDRAQAFQSHAKAQATRLNTAEVTLADLAIRIGVLEEWVLNIETRRRTQ